LAVKNEAANVKAALLSMDNDQVQVKADVETILEWRHEHHPDTMRYEADSGRVRLAQEWSEVAQALHEPIAVDQAPENI
jgi:hypothetical protein